MDKSKSEAGGRAAGADGGGGHERLSARFVKALWGMRGEAAGSWEEKLALAKGVLGDGLELLERESVESFAQGFEGGDGLEEMGGGGESGPGRVGLENVVAALEPEEDGEVWEIGLLALAGCEAMERAGAPAAAQVFGQMKDAIFYETPRPGALARACFGHPAYARCVREGAITESALEVFGDLLFHAIHEKREGLREGAAEALEELLDAWEGSEELRGAEPALAGGEMLMRLMDHDDARFGPRGERMNAELHRRAREWMAMGLGRPEQGEAAARLCASLDQALRMSSEGLARDALASLRRALDLGWGARRASGDQPLKILAGIRPRARGGEIAEEAAQALLEAGASERDLMPTVEEALSQAAHPGVAARVRASMERRELDRGLEELSDEERELVESFRRAQRREEQPRRRPGL